MDSYIFLSCIYTFGTLHSVSSDNSSFIDLSNIDYSIRQTFDNRNIQFKFDSKMASMKINCTKCSGQLDFTCQEHDFINVEIWLQAPNQTMTVPFNVSCSIRSDSKNAFIIDTIKTNSTNNKVFADWVKPSSTIKEYLVYSSTSTTHQSQQISTNHISFHNLSENTWHQICVASIDNLWRTSKFTCRNVFTHVFTTVTTRKYDITSTVFPSGSNKSIELHIMKDVIYGFSIYGENTLPNGLNVTRYNILNNFKYSFNRPNVSYCISTNQRTNYYKTKERLKDAMFEFIIRLKSSSVCVYSIHFTCADCVDPLNERHLTDKVNESRNSLLDCSNKERKTFKCDETSFNYSIKSNEILSSVQTHVYGVNLVGVHELIKTNQTWLLFVVLIAAVVICSIFFICLSISIRKSKRAIDCSKKKKQLENLHVPIKLKRIRNMDIDAKEFAIKYSRSTSDKSNPLIVEYNRLNAETQMLQTSLELTTLAGQNLLNIYKNRFVNILPYDHNRVHLKSKKPPFDYINASYIPFKNKENEHEYIATQNPIENTVSDFWEMIWTQNIYCILMIERNIQGEYFKCLQYWPNHVGDTSTYGPKDIYEITFVNENKMSSHIERLFTMKDIKSGTTRKITKFQIYSWFDHKIPDYEDFDNFLYRFTSLTSTNVPRPLVVHCSAGAGLTGTMICIDRIVRELIDGCQKSNIYDTVLSMRLYRHCMIQRQNQYNFIYGYINYFITKYMVPTGKGLEVSMKLWQNL